jgi:hypothetical protein
MSTNQPDENQQDNVPNRHWMQQFERAFDNPEEAKINALNLWASMDTFGNGVREPSQPKVQ